MKAKERRQDAICHKMSINFFFLCYIFNLTQKPLKITQIVVVTFNYFIHITYITTLIASKVKWIMIHNLMNKTV